jgi:hypothetical protein
MAANADDTRHIWIFVVPFADPDGEIGDGDSDTTTYLRVRDEGHRLAQDQPGPNFWLSDDLVGTDYTSVFNTAAPIRIVETSGRRQAVTPNSASLARFSSNHSCSWPGSGRINPASMALAGSASANTTRNSASD